MQSKNSDADRDAIPISIGVVAIDHNPILLEGIVVLIDNEPDMHVLGSANTASDGVKLYLDHSPDVTIIDLDLPRHGAFEVIRRIIGVNPRPKLVGLATYELDEAGPIALHAGVSSIVAKDRIAQELIAQVRLIMTAGI